MGCSSCGQSSNPVQIQRLVDTHEIMPNCPYTQDILNSWLPLLSCVKEKGTFSTFGVTPANINSYLGITQSAINYSTNPCYFKLSLDPIQTLVNNIISNGQC